jgi:hypothetical protein
MKRSILSKISLAIYFLLLSSGCSSTITNDADGSPVVATLEEQILGMSTTTEAANPYDNEDLVWIGDTCDAEQQSFRQLENASKYGDNPDLIGDELDSFDGPQALELAKKWINSIDEVYLALTTVGDYTLDLSARESAQMTEFRKLVPNIQTYGYWGDFWNLSLNEVRASHKELEIYCSMLPPNN